MIEEAGETALAGAKGNKDAIASEVADMLYHTLVLMAESGVKPDDVWDKLRERRV